jgi:hypothetical protein
MHANVTLPPTKHPATKSNSGLHWTTPKMYHRGDPRGIAVAPLQKIVTFDIPIAPLPPYAGPVFLRTPEKKHRSAKAPIRLLFHICLSCPSDRDRRVEVVLRDRRNGSSETSNSRGKHRERNMKMQKSVSQRSKLSRFVDLARVYRGWSKTELSRVLGRDPSKIIPESGNPKLDLLVGLAEALDWNVGDVAESVWCDRTTLEAGEACPFRDLSLEALSAHESGRYEDMLVVTRRMRLAASTPREHAITCNREVGAWDGLGRFPRALEASQEGLSIGCTDPDVQVMLQANLANAHYTLWHLIEAKAVARDLIERLEADPNRSEPMRVALGMAHYVRGHVARRQLDSEPDLRNRLAAEAGEHLRRSVEIHLDLAAEFSNVSYQGIANTSRGGLLEIDVALGRLEPSTAIQHITRELEQVVDPCDGSLSGDILESWGWWSIFGCNIALRHLDQTEVHRPMAILTNKAGEIADALGNWSLRERAFTLENYRRQRIADLTGLEPDWFLDEEEIRTISGTMGRFPGFRDVGWRILDAAHIFDSNP